MQFQLAGLASGFDWRSMIDQLMAVERIPQQRLREDQRDNTEMRDALELLETKMDTLKTTMSAFDDSALYNAKSTSLSDDTLGIVAEAATSAVEGNYEISVTQLATTSKRSGTADVGGSLGDANTVISSLRFANDITEGTFTINGQEITVQNTDTLQDVFDSISIATSGVVVGSYDNVSDKVTLTSSSGELDLGESADSSNFLSVLKLDQIEVVGAGGGSSSVSSTGALGVVDLASSIATSGISSGAPITGSGTITINGVAISFDADNESIGSLMGKVNDSAANVTMTYDTAADQFRIVNNETGALEMPVIDSANGLLAAIGLDGGASVGQDLQFSVDGGASVSSRSNVISESSHGITGLTITATETGTQTIGIGRDSKELREKINEFIASYNDVQDYILEKTKVTVEGDDVQTSVLSGNREVYNLDSKLRATAFNAIENLGGEIFRLEHMGIDFMSETSKLEIKDADALDEALVGQLDQLEQFFMGDIDGDGDIEESFATRMETFVENYTRDDGILDVQIENLANRNQDIDDRIEEMERRLEFTRSALEASFIAMEEAQSNIQQQSSALSGLQV